MDMMQVDRGVKGPIVVHPKRDRYAQNYSEEKTLFITDARRRPPIDLQLEGEAMDTGNAVVNEVNKVTWDGAYGNGTDKYPYVQYEVEQGKCYRFRWINAGGNLQNLQMKVAGHQQTVIAMDGEDVLPIQVTGFNIHAGERIDTIFCADQKPGNYLINATYDLACDLAHNGVGFGPDKQVPFIPLPSVDSCMFYAFIKYKGHDEIPRNADTNRTVHGGSPVGTGGGKGICCDSLDENCDQPGTTGDAFHLDMNTQETGYMKVGNVDVIEEPEKADMEITLYGGIIGDDFKVLPGGHNMAGGRGQFGTPFQAGWETSPNTHMFAEGGRTYLSERKKPRDFWSMAPHWPSSPVLHTQGKCGRNGANIIDIPEDKEVIELTLINLSPSAHVFHLHGMHFQVINYGFPNWCNYANHWICFFMPFPASHVVAKHTINGKSLSSDPKHPMMGGGFYWGIEPNKNHPNYKKTLNLKNPIRKDMISIWRHQWAVIRLRATNPGVWILHCHMEQHVPSGMMVAFNVKPSLQPPIPVDVPSSGDCPVRGWNHTLPAPPKAVSDSIEVWNWIVDYQRPTRSGKTWASKRLNPNQIEPEYRGFYTLAGDVFPARTLQATEGDSVAIQVQNRAEGEGFGLHFHGQEMRGTPWSDGVPGVSQAFIMPGTNHTIEFVAGTPGTHIYGALGVQGAQGLKGSFIVKPKHDLRSHLGLEDLLMQISDQWREPDVCLTYNGDKKQKPCPPVDKVTFDGMWGESDNKYYPLPEYKVKAGKCYRLRMVGLMSQVQRLNVSIESHKLTLLAVDGTEVQEVEVSSIALHAGERYDFKLCADQASPWKRHKSTFKITAHAMELCDAEFLRKNGFPAPESCQFEASLKYEGRFGLGDEHLESAMNSPTVPLDLASTESFDRVRPLEAPPSFKDEPDQSVEVRLGESPGGRMFLHTTAESWKLPSSPLLMTKGLACAEDVPLVHVDEKSTDLELTIHNELAEVQSVHLHGSRFQTVSLVLGNGESVASSGAVLRDTVPIPAGGSVVVRMVANNPGMWMLHAMSANALHRGAATVLNILPGSQSKVPDNVPTHACSETLLV